MTLATPRRVLRLRQSLSVRPAVSHRVLGSGSFAALAVLLTALPAAAQPSQDLASYVLFAEDTLRLRGVTVADGDLGVNRGTAHLRGTINAPLSDVAANAVKTDLKADCENMFANGVTGSAANCPLAPDPVPVPLINDVPAACDFPKPFPKCDDHKPVNVPNGQTVVLPPGVYGNLFVEGGGSGGPGTVVLNGTYTFCNVQASRKGRILFRGPSVVNVDGVVRSSNGTQVGPDATAVPTPTADQLLWFVSGRDVRFSRNDSMTASLCAPDARLVGGSGTRLSGQFVAKSIRLKRTTVGPVMTGPSVCGDGILSPDEECETDQDCQDDEEELRRRGIARSLVCSECSCIEGGSTTTTTAAPTTTTTTAASTTTTTAAPTTTTTAAASTTTTTAAPTTTTTLPGCTTDEDCNDGSSSGAFICVDGQCVPASTTTTTAPTTTTTSGVPGTSTTTTGAPTTTTTQAPATTTTTTTVASTTTTLPGCQTDEDCNDGSSSGAFICVDGQCVPASTTTTTVASTTTTSEIPGTTTTTTAAPTTTTTLPGCETDADCNDGSSSGAFICIDGQCVPVSTTTTTTTSTTTTTNEVPPSTTTTTTLPGCETDEDCPEGRCIEGTCIPECDDDADCNEGSPNGAIICVDGRCEEGSTTTTTTTPTTTSTSTTSSTGVPGTTTTTTLPECTVDADCNDGAPTGPFVCTGGRCVPAEQVAEICGDCIDNDGDGLVDFEDAADCCGNVQTFPMNLRKARFKPKATARSFLRIRSTLADSGLSSRIHPMMQNVFLQISQQEGGEVLCAWVPAGKFMGKKRTFKYWRRMSAAASAKNIDDMKVKITKSGKVMFRSYGKNVFFTTPPASTLQVTVAFQDPSGDVANNSCSAAVQAFQTRKKGIRYP